MEGPNAAGYVSLMGLRRDEERRYLKILKRCTGQGAQDYAPLYHVGIDQEDVQTFWKRQPFDLGVDSLYSNCTFCFLKGLRRLRQIATEGNGADGPSSLAWWLDMEERYGRHSHTTGQFYGFVGYGKRFGHEIMRGIDEEDWPALNCFCTD